MSQNVAVALSTVAIVDRSFFCRFRATGADRLDLLHRLSTNDIAKLAPGEAAETVFVTEKGRMIDRTLVLSHADQATIVSSPRTETSFMSWIDKYVIMEDFSLSAVTAFTFQYSILGPQADSVLTQLVTSLPRKREFTTCIVGSSPVLATRSLEFPGYDLLGEKAEARNVWETVSRFVLQCGGVVLDASDHDTYRIVMGVPAHGNEIVGQFNPYEVGLRSAISFTKGCYIGQEVIARLDTYDKIQRHLVGVVLSQMVPPDDRSIIDPQSQERVGMLTSVAPQRWDDRMVGLGIVKVSHASPGTSILVGAHRSVWATITGLPIPLPFLLPAGTA